MGYAQKLQKLCALRSLDQATLASRVGLSKSSMSRIFSGVQEPKLRLAYDLARALGVTLDYLVEESPELGPAQHLVTLSEEELMILKIARRLGPNVAIDRLLSVPQRAYELPLRTGTGTPAMGATARHEQTSEQFEAAEEELSEGQARPG